MFSSLVLASVFQMCSAGLTEEDCVYTTYTFSLTAGSFCVETRRLCCNEFVCSDLYYLSCYNNRIFVGNFERY